MTYLSRLAGFHCPDCGALQGWFALRMTFQGGTVRKRLNESLPCGDCAAALRLRKRPDGPALFLWQLILPILFGAGFLILAPRFIALAPPAFGLLGAGLALFVFTAVIGLILVGVQARLSRYFFQVEIL